MSKFKKNGNDFSNDDSNKYNNLSNIILYSRTILIKTLGLDFSLN